VELHISVAFIIATLCNVSDFESFPLALYHERTKMFRRMSEIPSVQLGTVSRAQQAPPQACLVLHWRDLQ